MHHVHIRWAWTGATPTSSSHIPIECGSLVAMGAQRMSFKRYVEVGRIVLISNGESKGKIATIVEIVDQNRVRILTALGGVRP